jgi:DNA-binding CsgD family transcriptional regulator
MSDTLHLITAREKEVLRQLAKGMTYGKMALQLGITPETVKKHLKNIYRKLKVSNKIEALNKLKSL